MNLFRTSVAFCSLGLMVFAGCGSSDSGGSTAGSGTTTGPTIDEVPAKFASVTCDVANQCFGSLLKVFLNGEDCVTRTQRGIEDGDLGQTKKLVADKKLTYDPAKAQACLDAYKAGGCAQLDTRAPAACDDVFGGKTAVGGDCTVDAECTPGNFCEAGSACPGKCAARKGEGVACTKDDQCADNLKCTGQKCAKPVAEGGQCGGGTGADCKAGLTCSGADDKTGKPGTCKTTAAAFSAKVGEACDVIQGQFCELGAACELAAASASGITWKCAAAYTSGGACKISYPNGCPSGEYCPVNLKSMPLKLDATCTKLPANGETCGLNTDGVPEICGPYAVCTAGKCAEKQRLDGSCTNDAGCYSERCKGGKCVPGVACEPRSAP